MFGQCSKRVEKKIFIANSCYFPAAYNADTPLSVIIPRTEEYDRARSQSQTSVTKLPTDDVDIEEAAALIRSLDFRPSDKAHS